MTGDGTSTTRPAEASTPGVASPMPRKMVAFQPAVASACTVRKAPHSHSEETHQPRGYPRGRHLPKRTGPESIPGRVRRMNRRFMLFGAVAALLIGMGLRVTVTATAGLGPADLARFEAESGVDLPDGYAGTPFFLMWTRGDGATYLTLAADLDLDGPARRLLSPRLRVSRLGFAALIWLFAFGRVEWFPISLFALSAVGLAAYGALTGLLAAGDRRAWWLLANPAVLIGFVGDSTEPVGLGLLLGVALSSHATLTAVGGSLLGGVRPSLTPATLVARRPWVAASTSATVTAALAVAGRLAFPHDPPFPFRPPLMGYVEAVPTTPLPDLLVAVMVAAAAITTLILGLVRRSGTVRWGWVLGALVVLSLPVRSIDAATNLLRIAGFLPVLWALGDGESPRRPAV